MRQALQVIGIGLMLTIAASPATGAEPPPGQAHGYGYGYRLRGYRWDAVLGQRWAVFEDATHPERPLVSLFDSNGGSGPLPEAARPPVQALQVVKPAELVVHSGDAVTLWKDDGNVRMQLAAVAQGNAPLGGRVQLKVIGAGVFGNAGWQATGLVRGPGNVEMQ